MKKLLLIASAASALAAASAANAVSYVYVGSWSVFNDAAPIWNGSPPNGPIAYTGREAAALLFGGTSNSYVISTAGPSVASINFRAWYDVIGVGGREFADNYSNKYLGAFYGPTDNYQCCGDAFANTNAASAFVRDNFVTNVNYAFRAVVPEPATWAMMIIGFGLVGTAMRRRPVPAKA